MTWIDDADGGAAAGTRDGCPVGESAGTTATTAPRDALLRMTARPVCEEAQLHLHIEQNTRRTQHSRMIRNQQIT